MNFTFHLFGYRVEFAIAPKDATSWHGWVTANSNVWCGNCDEILIPAKPGVEQRIDFDHVCRKQKAAA